VSDVESWDRVRERVLLLKRLYRWQPAVVEALCREFGVEVLRDGWGGVDTDGSLERLARVISDADLQSIVERWPPRYARPFRGCFYTVSVREDRVVLELRGSWDRVEADAREALKRLGYPAYAYLAALVDLGGRATFIDIITRAREAYGYDAWNTILLPRLAS